MQGLHKKGMFDGMGLLNTIARKITIWQYQYHDRNIIEDLPNSKFRQIISTYEADGWEVYSNQTLQVPVDTEWQGKLRKGSIVLNCDYTSNKLGTIYGPARVMRGMGKEFDLQPQLHPK